MENIVFLQQKLNLSGAWQNKLNFKYLYIIGLCSRIFSNLILVIIFTDNILASFIAAVKIKSKRNL